MSRILAFCVFFVFLPFFAHANTLDSFGFSPRASAMGGAQAADVRGHAATHHNPAGLGLGQDHEIAIGYGSAVTGLRINNVDARVTSPRGLSLGVALPFHFRKMTAAFGLALYMPDQYVVRIQLQPISEPQFIRYDNQLQHIVVTPAVAFRPTSWLSLGLGLTILADAAGNGITFDFGLKEGALTSQAAIDVSLPTRAAPVAGVTFSPRPWLRFGAAYRGEIDLRLKLDILTRVDVAGLIAGSALIALQAVNFYTPHKVALGLAIDLSPDLTVSAELDWLGWSYFHGAVPQLRVEVDLTITPSLVEARFPQARFRDQWIPRLGGELRRRFGRHVGFAARLGYAFERTPVPEQSGLTSFADNNVHILALGAGISLENLIKILPKPLRLDVALQAHSLEPRITRKGEPFVGQSFSSSGWLVFLSFMLEARF
jgi:long-subunit fatty acid transport protein